MCVHTYVRICACVHGRLCVCVSAFPSVHAQLHALAQVLFEDEDIVVVCKESGMRMNPPHRLAVEGRRLLVSS